MVKSYTQSYNTNISLGYTEASWLDNNYLEIKIVTFL